MYRWPTRGQSNPGHSRDSQQGCGWWLVLVCIVAVPQQAVAQTQPADASPAPANVEATEQQVAVDDTVSDAEIADRLHRILNATTQYTDLEVEVRDGIVFLRGATAAQADKEQAGQIARRTQDVVAVVNQLAITPPNVSDLAMGEVESLRRSFMQALPTLIVGSVVLVLALLFGGLLARLITIPLGHFTDSRLLHSVVRKLATLLIVLAGFVFFLRITGLTSLALTVVSGTGLFGLVLGFAFRDIAENFLASILLSLQTPFRLGDVIEVKGYTGVVQKVSTRGTVLIDFDGNHIQIANADVYKATLKNLTANPRMRLHFVIGIGYDASVSHAQELIMQVCREHRAVLDDPEPMVLVDTLGASTFNLKVYFWINSREHSWLKVKSAIMRQSVRSLEAQGVSLPDEAREIIFPQGVPVLRNPNAQPKRLTTRQVTQVSHGSDRHAEASMSEGNLTSDVDSIRKQARESRDPEAGPSIVEES